MASTSTTTNPWQTVGLTQSEYERIIQKLGRTPNLLELNLFGVMWSEHCSYKNSRALFHHFPTKNEYVLQGPGENAGIVDIGDRQAIAFKIESHNHPSALEPYQGAATGVGGIIRDIFAMGARPIALLNSLRFGNLENKRTQYLLDGVVAGIAGYGNCMGIPTVGGEVFFAPDYQENPLVNAMCVGLVDHSRIQKAVAGEAGNDIIYVGASTGRDGIGGASFASEELTEESESQRSAVQVGDPFMEKLLLEACLSLLEEDYVIGLQDLGAAGLTSSCSETASKGSSGIALELSKVPQREEGMNPTEIMISESQERMLIIAKAGKEKEIAAYFERWGLHAVKIGNTTTDGMLTMYHHGELVGEVPAKLLTNEAPVYERPYTRPDYIEKANKLDVTQLEEPDNYNHTLLNLLASPNICSRKWIYRQYDYQVRTNTIIHPGGDAALVRIEGTNKGIAISTDCNNRYCYLDPREGAKIAVAEGARNVVATGATPLAITDGLNFGNPEKADRYWQFRECILGISEACKVLNTPVISGNVSFYNETPTYAIPPTPIIGMTGLLKDMDKAITIGFKQEGDVILLIGDTKEEFGGSEYLAHHHGKVEGPVPSCDLMLEQKHQSYCLELIHHNWIHSAHDLSLGGFGVALVKCCIAGDLGANVTVKNKLRPSAFLFSETQSRFLVSLPEKHIDEALTLAQEQQIKVSVLGSVTANKDIILTYNDASCLSLSIEQAKISYEQTLDTFMN